MKHRTDRGASPLPYGEGSTLGRTGAASALSALGPVLYAVRLRDGLIKIGYTERLAGRMADLSAVELLGFRFGSRADEAALHDRLRPSVNRGREYYLPTPEVLAVVNGWRAAWGRSPVSA